MISWIWSCWGLWHPFCALIMMLECEVDTGLQRYREHQWNTYMHGGYKVCQKTYTILHVVSKKKIENIRDHHIEEGMSFREHGNTGKLPKYEEALKILQVIQN